MPSFSPCTTAFLPRRRICWRRKTSSCSGNAVERLLRDEVLRLQRRLYTLYYISKGRHRRLGRRKDRGGHPRIPGSTTALRKPAWPDEATQRALFSATRHRQEHQVQAGGEHQRPARLCLRPQLLRRIRVGRYIHLFNRPGRQHADGHLTTSTEPLNRWQYFQKFKCWAQYSFRITGDIWFHSCSTARRTRAPCATALSPPLGRKASHGCVRLRVEDAQWDLMRTATRHHRGRAVKKRALGTVAPERFHVRLRTAGFVEPAVRL